MVPMNKVDEFVHRLVEEYEPEKVILFGSYAYGAPSNGSDIDLLLVMANETSPHEKAVEILLNLRPDFPIDLVIRTPEQVSERLAWNDFFLQDIFDKGKVLYESANA